MADSANDPRLYFWVSYGVLVVIVMLTVIYAMARISEGDDFRERVIAEDLSLSTDLIMGSNGEIYFSYLLNNKSSTHILESSFFDDCSYTVVYEGGTIYNGATSYCVANNKLSLDNHPLSRNDKLIIEKSSSEFKIRGENNA